MPAPKKVTLEKVYAKLEEHDGRFEKMESRLGGVESQLGGVESRFGGVESRLGGVESRLGGVESRLGGMESRFHGMEKLMLHMEDSLRAEIGKVVQRVRQVETILEKQTGDLEKLTQEYFAIVHSLKRIEREMASRALRDEDRDRELKVIGVRLARVEARLGLVETGREI